MALSEIRMKHLRMTRSVNIEVYRDMENGRERTFGVLSEHRADLPEQFDLALQVWVVKNFRNLGLGNAVREAGEMVYEPAGAIIEFRKNVEEDEPWKEWQEQKDVCPLCGSELESMGPIDAAVVCEGFTCESKDCEFHELRYYE